MRDADFAAVLRRFDAFNDSTITSFAVENIAADKCDVLLRLLAHDSEAAFSSKEVLLKFFDVERIVLSKESHQHPFLLSNGATYFFDGVHHHLELGGNGEPKTISEMQKEDVYLKFDSFIIQSIAEI